MNVTAKAQRSGGWWAVEVPEIDGLFTQAKCLGQIPAVVADAAALLEDVSAESVEVTVEAARVSVPRARAAQDEASAAMQVAARGLGGPAQGRSVETIPWNQWRTGICWFVPS